MKPKTSLSRNSRNLLKPTPHTPQVLRLHRAVIRVEDRASRHQHHVDRDLRPGPPPPEDLPQEPLRAVSLDRAPHLSARDEAHPQRVFLRGDHERYEERVHPPSPLAIHALEIRPTAQAEWSAGSGLRQTEIRCRPLRRRRASTARPAFERILTRKPWVRLRRRRFGWNVLFILSRLPLHAGSDSLAGRASLSRCRRSEITDATPPHTLCQQAPICRASLLVSAHFSTPENFFLSTNNPYARLRPSSGRHRRNTFHRGGVPRSAGFPHLLIFLWKTPVGGRLPPGERLSSIAFKSLWCR